MYATGKSFFLCERCHNIRRVQQKQKSTTGWKRAVRTCRRAGSSSKRSARRSVTTMETNAIIKKWPLSWDGGSHAGYSHPASKRHCLGNTAHVAAINTANQATNKTHIPIQTQTRTQGKRATHHNAQGRPTNHYETGGDDETRSR